MQNIHDITEHVAHAITHGGLWSTQKFFDVLKQLEVAGCNIHFWEDEENWAVIRFSDKTIGYVLNRCPIIILNGNYENLAGTALHEFNVDTVLVKNLIDKCLTIDNTHLDTELFCSLPEIPFSAEDLWFYTST